MDFILGRYRNLSVLLVVVFGQLILLAYQVRSNQQVRILRVWAITVVAPMAKGLENARSSVDSFFNDYLILLDVREQNRRFTVENNRLKLENNFLKTEIATADRAKALLEFKGRSPSKMIAARIVATSTSATTVVTVDRGISDGVYKGMAVVTADGIVGKVLDSFPIAAYVQLITDPQFGAGVVSQKNHVYGTLQGRGDNRCRIDRVQNEENVEVGEAFYTTGEDRIFPKGLEVGRVVSVQAGPTFKQIEVVPTVAGGLEEVLIVLEGVHQDIPPPPSVTERISLIPPPPGTGKDGGQTAPAGTPSSGMLTTDADKIADRYRVIEEQRGGTKFGAFGSQPPSFATIPVAPKKEPLATPLPGTPPAQPQSQPQLQAPPPAAPASKPAPPKPAATDKVPDKPVQQQ